MNKINRYLLFLVFILSGCSGQAVETAQPTVQSISTAHPSPSPEPDPLPGIPDVIPTSTPLVEENPNFRVSPIDGMPQAFIPAGSFHMGGYDVRAAPDEFPAHEVSLYAYWMDQLEVTNAMYQLCVDAGICTLPQSLGSQRRKEYFSTVEFKDYPVVYVTWGQAKTYCEWAERRLPTEAEWERAARGDDLRTFPWGEDKADERFANFNMLVTDTSRVGSYPMGASPFGILDMAGNVAEWTNDLYSSTFYATALIMTNPTGPASGSGLRRVVRGGSLGDAEINIRVPKRSSVLGSDLNALKDSPEYLGDFSPRIGFRCAQSN